MSLTANMVSYIAANSTLTVDTDLFVAQIESDIPNKAVWVREPLGSTENESGVEQRIIEIFAQDITFLLAETLANEVYELLAHKKGFTGALSSEDIFYCEPVGKPGVLMQDGKGRYVFLMSFMVRKK